MATVYSTCDVHPRDSIAYWVEVVTHGFVKCAVTPSHRPSFQASVHTGSLGALGVSSYECDPNEVTRGSREISRADSDDLFICLQLSGRSINFQGDREAVIDSGSFFLLDPQRPFTGRSVSRGKMVAVGVPRQMFEARAGNAAALVSRTMDGRKPLSALAYGFLTMLPNRIDDLNGSAAAKVAEQAVDLVALAFSTEAQRDTTLSSSRAVAITVLKAAIEARLHDPGLKPTVAAAAAGISIRYANAMLAQEDTCLERYIFHRRLERCRRALEDPAQQRRMIGDIALGWGFSDLSHFGRRFKAAFGCSASEYRKRSNHDQS
jgi:AraC family transcriptional regulator, positive regulator of tynA and feaB